jgi:hypothetical protein
MVHFLVEVRRFACVFQFSFTYSSVEAVQIVI